MARALQCSALAMVGSADLLPYNLDHRVKLLFPVEDACLCLTIIHGILDLHLRDTAQARRPLSDST
jgi:polyphosphate kinase